MRKVYLLFLLLCFAYCSLNAQKIDTVEVSRNKDGAISEVKLNEEDTTRPNMKQAVSFLKRLHNSPSDVEFRLLKKVDQGEFNHQRFQQFYKGIKVEGSQYIVHSKDDLIESSNGGYAPLDNISVTPSISEKSAVQLAISNSPSKQFDWQSETDSLYPKGELVIAQSPETRKWSLSWKFLVSGTEPLRSDYIYVDARNGNIVRMESAICYTNTPGTADTRYSGNRAIIGDSFNGAFRLQETINGVNISTMNFNHSGSPGVTSVATEFVDNNNTWTAAEWNNANMDNAALDVHWGLERTEEYFRVVHGRNGLDGSGHRYTGYVHYSNSWNNAMWWPATKSVYFGDGSAGNPLTSLDVVAHEIGHGICFFEAGLGTLGENGALNEGLSDIWGAVVEWYSNTGKDIWAFGESVLGVSQRSLIDPKSRLDPDTYEGQYWTTINNCISAPDGCGIHSNLGVIDHWFYLVSEGGSGTNDIGNSYNVSPIGIQKAAAIVYYAERFYFTNASQYIDARSHMIAAASALYGANSCEVRTVTNAWFAVGVGAAFTATLNPQMTGPSAFCSGSQVYTVPDEIVTSWSLNPASGPATLTGTGNNSRTLTKNFDYNVTITANISNACDVTGLTASSIKTVKLGLPPLTGASVNGPSSVPPQNQSQYYALLPSWATGSKQWIVPSGWSVLSGQGTTGAVIQSGTSGGAITFRLTSCGVSRDVFKTVTICSGCSGASTLDTTSDVLISNKSRFVIHPNPANTSVTISIDGLAAIKEYKIIDGSGRIIQQQLLSSGTKSKNVDVSQLQVGFYFISINNGKEWINKKLIIRR